MLPRCLFLLVPEYQVGAERERADWSPAPNQAGGGRRARSME